MTTLVITAHPDDEALSCGGLIQNRILRKDAVFVLCVFGRYYPALSKKKQLEQEVVDLNLFQDSLSILGHGKENLISGTCLGIREGEPHKAGYYDLILPIEKYLLNVDPIEVIIPSPTDLNQDHRFLHELCKIAVRPANTPKVRRVLMWHGLDGGTPAGANWFEAMTETELDTKQKAFMVYKSEARPLPHARAPSNIEAHAAVCGSICSTNYAEPFTLLRMRYT